MNMNVYVAHWAKSTNGPESIVSCEPWVDHADGSLNLELRRGKQVMTLVLSSDQFEAIRKLVDESPNYRGV